jgi:hypothetical protein
MDPRVKPEDDCIKTHCRARDKLEIPGGSLFDSLPDKTTRETVQNILNNNQ